MNNVRQCPRPTACYHDVEYEVNDDRYTGDDCCSFLRVGLSGIRCRKVHRTDAISPGSISQNLLKSVSEGFQLMIIFISCVVPTIQYESLTCTDKLFQVFHASVGKVGFA